MTTGLDPAARHVAWDLIRAIRDKGTTVVLVTHFMDEAEELCDRLAIIDHGKVIASDSPAQLINTHTGNISVIFSCDNRDLSWLNQVGHVRKVTRKGSRVEIEGSGPVVAHVASALLSHGIEPSDFRTVQSSLEDVFLKLTGRRDGD
jgi:ABC-2 type transport system ATP-binding protein